MLKKRVNELEEKLLKESVEKQKSDSAEEEGSVDDQAELAESREAQILCLTEETIQLKNQLQMANKLTNEKDKLISKLTLMTKSHYENELRGLDSKKGNVVGPESDADEQKDMHKEESISKENINVVENDSVEDMRNASDEIEEIIDSLKNCNK